MALAEEGSQAAAAEALGTSPAAVKQVIARARKKVGADSALSLYHKLVRGVRFETVVTTKMVVEED